MLRSKKTGFTIVELLVSLAIIGILATIVSFRYIESQKRAKTLENRKRAQDTTIAIEQFILFLGNSDRHYPAKDPSGGFASEDQVFFNELPIDIKETISTDQLPSHHNSKTLYYSTCKTNGYITGVRLGYWNFLTNQVDYITTGQADPSQPDTHCD